jgi:predicted DCC family thiol-disulfide oxidoreductase YuxK
MVLLYSGGCKVCRWTARTIISRIDRHKALDIVPFRHPLGQYILAGKGLTDIETIKQHWWFVDRNGKLWQGNRGGAKQLLMAFSNTRWWARFIPSRVLDWADDVVNRNRPRIAAHLPDLPPLVRVQGSEETPVYGWELFGAQEVGNG